MFENSSERLDRSFKLLRGEGRITEINTVETLKDVCKALLDADVDCKVAKSSTDTVKKKALGQNVLTSVRPSQLMVKIVHDELASLVDDTAVDVDLQGDPTIILMSGLQGSGKTTFTGKLVSLLKTKKNKKPLLVTCGMYHPTVIEQLHVVGRQVGVPAYMELENKNPVETAMNAVREARAEDNGVVIVDAAGRLAIDEQMMNEIAAIRSAIQPDETLFVIDAVAGQDAVNTAREFNERLNFDGVVFTEPGGDTRGGAALSIRTVVDEPIKFIGTDGKMGALGILHPGRMTNRILGIGDTVSLVEHAQEQYDEERTKRLQGETAKNQFGFNDFISQIQQIKKMGNLKELASIIPGVGKALKDADIDDNAFGSIEAIIYPMTPDERSNPAILSGSRRKRIAKGSSTSIQKVNKLIRQFGETRKMIRTLISVKLGKMKLPSMKPSFRR